MAAKRNNQYWQKRMAVLEDKQYQKSQKYIEDVRKQYDDAIQALQRDTELWYARLAENNEISYAKAKQLLKKSELEEFHWSVEQYIKAGRENAIDERWAKELENASAKYHITRLEAIQMQIRQHMEVLQSEFDGGMEQFLAKTFEDNYYHMAFEVAKGTGIGTTLYRWNPDKVEAIIKTPWAQDGKNFSSRIWDNKEKLVRELHRELIQCIIRGEAPDRAVKELSKTMNVSKRQAGTLIMTESAAISSVAQQKCFTDLGVEEFEVVETLDGHTCTVCGDMDGMHFPMNDFKVGITAPPFHPNCRGCTCPYFNDEFTEGEKRAARNPNTGKTEFVQDMTYKEWKDEFVVDAGNDKTYTMGIRLPDDVNGIKGFTPEIKGRMENAIHMLQKEYAVNIHSISVEKAERGDIFVTGYYEGKMGIVINKDADFDMILKRIPYLYQNGYMAGKSLEDYVAHEIFHVLMYQDCTSDNMYRARFSQVEALYENLNGISGYADMSQSGNEALAEAFVRLRNGEEIPAIAKILIESYIGKWKK